MSLAEQVATHWEAIEGALAQIAPACAATLAPPATPEEIERLEGALGLELPDDLSASLRRHNGQNDPQRLFDFCGAGVLLSTADIAETWRMVTEIDEQYGGARSSRVRAPWWKRIFAQGSGSEVRVAWWKRTLVPFTDADGSMLCVDVDPSLPQPGEVVWHRVDGEIERGIAGSYAAWLAELARRIQNGGLRLDESGYPDLDPSF